MTDLFFAESREEYREKFSALEAVQARAESNRPDDPAVRIVGSLIECLKYRDALIDDLSELIDIVAPVSVHCRHCGKTATQMMRHPPGLVRRPIIGDLIFKGWSRIGDRLACPACAEKTRPGLADGRQD